MPLRLVQKQTSLFLTVGDYSILQGEIETLRSSRHIELFDEELQAPGGMTPTRLSECALQLMLMAQWEKVDY